jgi:hypothetical protein
LKTGSEEITVTMAAHQFNPLATNKFETRDDVAAAVTTLFEALVPYFSAGKARVEIDASCSTHDRAACDLEGWAV